MRFAIASLAIVWCMLAIIAPRAGAAESADEQLAAASALYDAHKYAEAAQKLDQFLAANPGHPKTGAAAFALGRCRTELKDYARALPAYDKAVASGDKQVVDLARLGLAEAAMNTKQYDRAAPALEAVVRTPLKPEQLSVAWYWLGQADYQLGRYGQAEEAYSKVAYDYPKSDFADDALYGGALAALKQKHADAARQKLRELADRYPKSEYRPAALLRAGQIDLDAKRWGEARGELETLLRELGASADMRRTAEDGLIEALLQMQDYGAAATRLDAVLARLPAGDAQRYRAELSLGHCRYRQRQFDQALAAYQEAAKSSDAQVAADGLYWAANACLALNRPGDAGVLFGKVAARYPKSPLAAKAQLKAGDAFAAAKQPAPAAQAYQAVVANFPQAPEAADARKALGDAVAALTDPAQLAQALKGLPPTDRAPGTLRLARIYMAAKRYPEAAAALAALPATGLPNEVAGERQYLIGLVAEEQDKLAAATTAFAEAVRLDGGAPWAPDANARLATLYLDAKRPADAEQAASSALSSRLAPDVERQARLTLVQAQMDQQKWDAALDGTRQLLAANPPTDVTATVLYTQAWIDEKRAKPEDALPIWERLSTDFARSPYAAEALLKVGDARMKAQKLDEARDRYSALLAGFPKSPFAAEARFKMASALYNLDKPADAATEYDAVAADKTAGDYAPEALYWAGVAYEKAGKKDEAIKRLARLVAEHPTHARVKSARVRLAALRAVAGP